MKQARKMVALLMALALVALAGCRQKTAPDPSSVLGEPPAAPESSQAPAAPEKSLQQHGQELVSLMAEMVRSSQYTNLYTGDQEVQQLLATAGEGDFSAPQAVYAIRLPETALDSLLALAGMGSISGFSPELRQVIQARVTSALPTQINAMGGANVLAAASVCTASDCFVSSQPPESVIYLYTYQNAVPAAVSFIPGEGGAVAASGMLILYQGGETMEVTQLRELLEQLGAEMEEVTQ